MTHATLTATIWREAQAYVSLCPSWVWLPAVTILMKR